MKILVIGSGGREHALCEALQKNAEVIAAPGNPGIAESVKCFVDCPVDDIKKIVSLAEHEKVSLVVVGPELPLSLGLADALAERSIPVFGPQKQAAALEYSKRFAKEIMMAAGVPTARYKEFTDQAECWEYVRTQSFPLVLKADGLAAGKGVVVCLTLAQAEEALPELFSIPKTGETSQGLIIVEEFISGVEVSCIVVTDGERIVPLALAHDYKRLKDNDQGPNTGGMGTVSPSPRLASIDSVVEQVIRPTLGELKVRGIPFCGFLYAGLMIKPDGSLCVLEFNARMGDPEGQVILPRTEGNFAEVLFGLATKTKIPELSVTSDSCVSVVIAAAGYPASPRKGDEITGLELVRSMPGVSVYHAGTRRDASGKFFTHGGRILNVTARGQSLEAARQKAYRAADMIQFAGCQLRRDIGLN